MAPDAEKYPASIASKMTGAILASALEYAARGWHVLALDPRNLRPVTSQFGTRNEDDPWCRPRWELRATTDPDRISRIWAATPWALGIACGPSSLLVVDTSAFIGDTGEGALAALAAIHGSLPATWTVATPSGGLHRYFTQPGDLGNTVGRLGPRISTHGAGGYIVAPPTTTNTGRYDQLLTDPVAPLPTWVTRLLS